MNRKTLILLAITTIVLTMGAGCATKTATTDDNYGVPYNGAVGPSDPNETVFETTYQNDTYGFSFDYNSEEFSVAESRSRGGATGDESDLIRMTAIGESCPAVDIFVSTATLEQELSDLELRISGDTEQTTVAGIAATKRSGEITENLPPCGSEKTEIVFENDDNVFVITAFKNSESSLDELLESIDFTVTEGTPYNGAVEPSDPLSEDVQSYTPYTDTKSGISFTVPTGWIVSTDEAENLYTYRENPYLTVTFTTFSDKEGWQKRISEWNSEITKGNTTQKDSTIGGYSAELLETGIYGNYYVDGRTKWFEVSTADQNSAEISAIIQSVKF